MGHNPLRCLWRRGIRPWIFSGADLLGTPPKGEALTDDMTEALVKFVYADKISPGNLDDFVDWVRDDHQRSDHGARAWNNYFGTDEGALVCSPMPGLVFEVAIYCGWCVKVVAIGLLLAAAVQGVAVWLR
jgi:hypothetical protein